MAEAPVPKSNPRLQAVHPDDSEGLSRVVSGVPTVVVVVVVVSVRVVVDAK